MSSQAMSNLRYCSAVLQTLKFALTDQNPKGIRDLLPSAIREIEEERTRLRAALERIQHEATIRPLEHAEQTIEDLRVMAAEALTKAKGRS